VLRLQGNERLVDRIRNIKRYSKKDVEEAIYHRHLFIERVKARWTQLGLEALICPAYITCAFKNTSNAELSNFVDYTGLWNVLNFPCGVVPVTEVAPGEDLQYGDAFNDRWTQAVKENVEGSVGMPIGV